MKGKQINTFMYFWLPIYTMYRNLASSFIGILAKNFYRMLNLGQMFFTVLTTLQKNSKRDIACGWGRKINIKN